MFACREESAPYVSNLLTNHIYQLCRIISILINQHCYQSHPNMEENELQRYKEAIMSQLQLVKEDESKKKEVECPLNKSELGNQTWGFLHTMAAYFPDKPSADDQRDMAQFLKLFSKFYPCPTCARDFSKLIEKEPPRTSSQIELKHWLCWAHNQVNKKLGKPKFDCSKLDERWKYGWKDGSCDGRKTSL